MLNFYVRASSPISFSLSSQVLLSNTRSQAEGPLNRGVVYVHMVRAARSGEFEYKYLYIDVRGHPRIYLENSDVSPPGDKKGFKLFGVNWGQK